MRLTFKPVVPVSVRSALEARAWARHPWHRTLRAACEPPVRAARGDDPPSPRAERARG